MAENVILRDIWSSNVPSKELYLQHYLKGSWSKDTCTEVSDHSTHPAADWIQA
jgi:hypothetical protein